jgi:hypothetical protein
MRSNSAWLVALGATTSSSRPAPSWVARNTAWWIDQLAGTWLLAPHPGGPVLTSTFMPLTVRSVPPGSSASGRLRRTANGWRAGQAIDFRISLPSAGGGSVSIATAISGCSRPRHGPATPAAHPFGAENTRPPWATWPISRDQAAA